MNIKNIIYKRVRFCHVPSFSYYVLYTPVILYYQLTDRILKRNSHIDEVLRILNTVRIETANYDKVDEKGKHSLKCYYKYDDKNVYLKCRFYKKTDEDEYEKFRNSIDIHCDYGMSDIISKKGYFHFVVYIQIEPIYEYYIDSCSISIGTYHKGILKWEYSKYPHLLMIGETGQGKSVHIRYLLKAIFERQYDVWCIDGKKVDYSKVKNKFKHYAANSSDKVDIINLLTDFKNDMQSRFDSMVERQIYNYFEDERLEPVFLLIDEYLMIVETADSKELKKIKSLMSEIILLGRSAGYFLIVTMQRADAKYIDGAIRDNFACRVVVGKASKESYAMIFDRKVKGFDIGRAWVQINNDMHIISIPYYEDF